MFPVTRLLFTDVDVTLPLNTTASGPVFFDMPPVDVVPLPAVVDEPLLVHVVELAV